MEHDCSFFKENDAFRYRTGGLIVHNNKMLFIKSSIADYYYIIGGGVHLCETSISAIEREVFEESGITAKADRLAVVCENFFKGDGGVIDGFDCHMIELYYIMKVNVDNLLACKKFTDSDEELIWLPIDKVSQYNIKPTFIKNHIDKILSGDKILHFIEESDR